MSTKDYERRFLANDSVVGNFYRGVGTKFLEVFCRKGKKRPEVNLKELKSRGSTFLPGSKTPPCDHLTGRYETETRWYVGSERFSHPHFNGSGPEMDVTTSLIFVLCSPVSLLKWIVTHTRSCAYDSLVGPLGTFGILLSLSRGMNRGTTDVLFNYTKCFKNC